MRVWHEQSKWNYLTPATIVHFRRKGLVSKAIRWASRSPGEEPSESSHVALVSSTGMIIEAVYTGPRVELPVISFKGAEVCFAEPLNLTDEERFKIVRRAWDIADDSAGYGFLKVALHAGDTFLSRAKGRNVVFFRRLSGLNRWPMCSFLVERGYLAVDCDFGVYRAEPDDIYDFNLREHDKYRVSPWMRWDYPL